MSFLPVTAPISSAGGTITGATTISAVLTETAGTATSGASSPAVISSPGFSSGVASQLSDLTRDYMIYVTIGTGGGTVSVAIGPTNTPANTLVNAAVGINGESINFRLPAAWFCKITVATSTIASQIAIGC